MKRVCSAMAALVFCTTSVFGQSHDLNVMHPTGVYVQEATGMRYPESVGKFQRASIIRYKEDGTDESAGYNRAVPLNEIVATVYVFPSFRLRSFGSPRTVIEDARNHLCTDQFQAIEKEVTSAHPDAVLLRDGATSLAQGNVKHEGHMAAYRLTNPKFAGRSDVALHSDVYVFCYAGGKWTVEYRIDYPLEYDAGSEIADFMRDLVWTIPPEPGN
jgi:hypothetical protein